jgi:hypothetical protein
MPADTPTLTADEIRMIQAMLANWRADAPVGFSAPRLRQLCTLALAGIEDARIVDRLEYADTILLCDEETSNPTRRYSFRDMATPPTAESPDGTIYGPTVRAVMRAALDAASPPGTGEAPTGYNGEEGG